ncbi:MAG TPA: Nif3-like dinuclear metal center hexameric protein [Armatimonadota bacterium]|jgi:dinuclear metal center YbgI/SA1388 family protein
MPRVLEVIEFLREFAPENLAEPWDKVGLHAGDPDREISGVLVCLDVTLDTVQQAVEVGAGLVVSHHPLLFHPAATLREDQPEGKLLCAVTRAGLSVYCAHTNLDATAGGVNDCLATALELRDTRPLEPQPEPVLKLAVFTPPGYVERLLQAMSGAGAGQLGAYSHCSFQFPGIGTYLPMAGAEPFVGEVGRLERAEEVRLEMIVPDGCLERVLAAMLEAHPYEEVAYDAYPLHRPHAHTGRGLGRVGRLPAPLTLAELQDRVALTLQPSELGVVGDPTQSVETVAVLGGSGGKYVTAARRAGAHAFVTGEVGHHDRLLARDLGLAVLDAGHEATETVVLEPLAGRLRRRFEGLKVTVAPRTFGPFAGGPSRL